MEDFNVSPMLVEDLQAITYENNFISIGHNSQGCFFINKSGKRISIYFDDIQYDSAGVFILNLKGVYGLANVFGDVILKPHYLVIDNFSENVARVKDGYNWGFIDIDGNVIVKPMYKTVGHFQNGVAEVSRALLHYRSDVVSCLINKQGQAILNQEQLQVYTDFCFVTKEGAVLVGIKHNSTPLLDGWNNVYYIPDNQLTSNIVFGGPNIFFYNEYLEQWRTIYDLDTKLYGMISRDGKIIIPCVFKSILERKHYLVGEVPPIQTKMSTKLEIDKEGWSSFASNDDNKQSLSLSCKSFIDGSWCFEEERILKGSNIFHQCAELQISDNTRKYLYYVEYNGKYGIVDSVCSPVIPILYDEIVIPSAMYQTNENVIREWFRYGGRESYHPCANSYRIYQDFLILCRKRNEWCIFKCHDGEMILAVEEKFTEIHLYDSVTFLVKQNERYGVFQKDTLVIPCLYDNVLLKNEKTQYNQSISSIVKVQRNENVGLYYWSYSNPEKNSYVEPSYKDVYVTGERIIVKSHNGKMGIIDLSGREIIPVGMDTIEYVPVTQSYILCSNGFYGIVNSEGETLVPFMYSRIEPLGSAYICTKDTTKMFYSGDCETSFKIEELVLIDTIESIDGNLLSGEEKHRNNPNLQYVNKTYEIEDKGLYVVTCDSKVGVVNKSGNVIVPIYFQRVGLVSSDLILAFDDSKMKLYSLDGNNSSEYYDDIIALPKYLNSSFKYVSRYEYSAFYVKRDLKVGILSFHDDELHIEYPCIFDELSLGETFYSDRIYIGNKPICEESLGPYGNKIKKSDKLLWCSDFNCRGLAIAADYQGNFCIINSRFNCVADFKYSNIIEIDPFHYAFVGQRESSKSLFNSVEESTLQTSIIKYDRILKKTILNTYPYRIIAKISGDLYVVQQDGLYGVVKYCLDNEMFSTLIEIAYDEIRYEALTIIVRKDGLYGCYNLSGNCLLGVKYNSIKQFSGDNYKHMLPQDKLRFRYKGILLEATTENGIRCIYRGSSQQYQIFDSKTCLDICYFNKDSDKEGAILKAYNNQRIQFFSLCLRKKSEIYTSTEFKEHNYRESGCSVMINDRYGYIDFETFDLIPCRHAQQISYLEQSHRFWKFESTDQIYDSHLNRMLNISLLHGITQYERNTWKVYVYKNTNSVNGYNRYSPKNVGLYDSSMRCIIPAEYDDITVGLENQFIATSNFTYDEYQLIDDIHRWRKCKECSIYNKGGEKLYTCTSRILLKIDSHNQKYYLIEGSPSLVSINGREFFDLAHGHIVKEFISDHCSHYYSDTNHDGSRNLMSSFGKEYFNVEAILAKEEITILKIRGRYIAISEEKELTPASHYRIVVNNSRKYITLMDYYKRVFIDFEGNYIGQIEGKFSNCLVDKSSGVITAISKNDRGIEEYRLYSLDGVQINSTTFSFIGTFSDGYATCVINSEEKLDREFFENTQSEFFFYYNHNNYGKWGIINNNGEIVIPMKYDFIRAIRNGITIYVENHKYGILNINSRVVKPAEFDFLLYFSEGLCVYKEFFWSQHTTQSKTGFIDEDGNVRILPRYKTATPFKLGKSKVTSFDDYVNTIDANGSRLQNWELSYSKYESDEDDSWSGYTTEELEEMYRDAMGGDPTNEWNID